MARKHLRISDLPNLENCTLFLEYDKAPLPDTYVLIENKKPVFNIWLKKCRIIPDPDDEVDGFHVFIQRSKIPPVFHKNNSLFFKKLKYKAEQEMVREALEKNLIQITCMGIIGDKTIRIWCSKVIEKMEYYL